MIIVSDTGPIVHLHWLGIAASALPDEEIWIVPAVWREVESLAPDSLTDSRFVRVEGEVSIIPGLEALGLDVGEHEALSYAVNISMSDEVLVLCDERAARSVCDVLGFEVRGSVGLIVEAYRMGRLSRHVAEISIRELPTRGRCRLSAHIVNEAVRQLDSPTH